MPGMLDPLFATALAGFFGLCVGSFGSGLTRCAH
jgi:hypothetical protein